MSDYHFPDATVPVGDYDRIFVRFRAVKQPFSYKIFHRNKPKAGDPWGEPVVQGHDNHQGSIGAGLNLAGDDILIEILPDSVQPQTGYAIAINMFGVKSGKTTVLANGGWSIIAGSDAQKPYFVQVALT